ncbi:MAG: DUF6932 family protein [Acidimicrobiales bacterium]
MIPPFDDRGLLPSSDLPYSTTMDEVEQRFVVELDSPAWRVELFDGFKLVHAAVAESVPSAYWWLWGCFVSNHQDPVMGNSQVMNSLAILPVRDLPLSPAGLAMVVGFLQVAEINHRVDAPMVYEFDPGDEQNIDTMEALEKWRPRAEMGVADHGSGLLVPARFLELLP